MPNPYCVASEVVLALLFGVCLRHAARAGPARVWQLIAGILFGLLLEWATIQQLHSYRYGRFLVMLGDVPLMVGVGWGVIIYSVRLFSDASGLPEWARPILDGLLALNIDLVMDAVAIRLGLWDWGQGLQWQYFGVPYANFWAWFWVVASFSAGLRALARPATWAGRWLGPLGAIVVGLAVIIAMDALITAITPAWQLPPVALTLGAALALVVWLRPRLTQRPADPLVFWVPLGIHAYFLTAGLLSRAILRPPVLLLVSLAMLALALYLHWATIQSALNQAPAVQRSGLPPGE